MVSPRHEATRPASQEQDAPSPAKLQFKLRDGTLTVSVFAKPAAKDKTHLFVVPERAYRDKNDEWKSTHLLHEEDLLRMSLLLSEAYSRLRHVDAVEQE